MLVLKLDCQEKEGAIQPGDPARSWWRRRRRRLRRAREEPVAPGGGSAAGWGRFEREDLITWN
ncbi:hypothetical protein MC885_021233 [Smutsia gigantea]|nr:hypothetical protein MC885_021233 [Smutsia gigantea]